ncbi:phage tail spike protein [Ruoffia sp. FAM 24228]|uniref:phage tail spike protein n=1 Tax=Ruoffia sp. FAM 24228 TaxID=3259517 RepID=UPI003885B4D1
MEILDREFNRLCWMDNNTENGLHFTQDKLSTSIDGGIYTLEFSSPKDSPQAVHLKEGHYITFLNRQGVRVLGTIMTIHDVGRYKKVYMEDTSLNLINKIVTKQELPATAQPISFYLNNVLKETGWEVGDNESNTSLQLEYTNSETLLARIRKIASDFSVEFYFETLIDTPGAPQFYIHIVKQRLEGDNGFRLSSDDFIEGIERKVNIDNVVTKLIIEGKETTSQSAGSTTTNKQTTVTTKKYEQPVAKQFDASKATGATRLSTSGWNLAEVNKFNMNQADPPHVTGAYIDTFLRNFYPDSPLVGQGQKIKDYADYYGIAVGAVLGVWAKETTFGRAHPGKVDYNYGCIRWTSGYQSVTYAGSQWRKYSTKEAGIADWFHLVRYNYVETGQANYEAFLNKYSPTFENNHATFKNLMWSVIKSFGYNTSDNTTKKNYSSSSDNPLTLKVSNTSASSNVSTAPSKSAHDEMMDKMIKWFADREGKVTYSMSARSGPSSYDCSSALYSALFYAGFKPNINYLGSTVSLWNDIGTNKLMYEIKRSEARRGDIFLSGAKGSASAGASGHTGVFLSNNQIIHCNFRDNGITRTPVEGRAGSPLYVFRLVNKNPQVKIGGHISNMPTSSKVEGAVKRALSQVGGRYVWGGVAFKANDCSGLIYEAYRYAGFRINHRCTTYTIAQQKSPFKKISASEARRGDLVVQHGGGHVAILLGTPNSGAGIVHSATPELGIITQKSITNVNGYYRVMDV